MLAKKKLISAALAGVAGLLIATSASASQPGAYAGVQLGWGNTQVCN